MSSSIRQWKHLNPCCGRSCFSAPFPSTTTTPCCKMWCPFPQAADWPASRLENELLESVSQSQGAQPPTLTPGASPQSSQGMEEAAQFRVENNSITQASTWHHHSLVPAPPCDWRLVVSILRRRPRRGACCTAPRSWKVRPSCQPKRSFLITAWHLYIMLTAQCA